jgi:hypothetical protein
MAAFAATACAQQPVVPPDQDDWPSPDGKFAFLTSYGQGPHMIDLTDKTSGKKSRIDESDFKAVHVKNSIIFIYYKRSAVRRPARPYDFVAGCLFGADICGG